MAIRRDSPREIEMIEQFKRDVDRGLSHRPKTLPSKYFYDKRGDALFVAITRMSEYYLTRVEFEILSQKAQLITQALGLQKGRYFELVELGAGDGSKTKVLIRAWHRAAYRFTYMPIDISPYALDGLAGGLIEELPGVSIRKQCGDYFEILDSLRGDRHPKVVLFLGSNMGNMSDERAAEFVYELGVRLRPDDSLLLGLDLIKDASIVLPAYRGDITRDFNLNLLLRINGELGGEFDVSAFKHRVAYDVHEGIVNSYLESTRAQEVRISKIGKRFSFEKGEKIHTEISRKYNDSILARIIADSGFRIVDKLTDGQGWFADYVLKRC